MFKLHHEHVQQLLGVRRWYLHEMLTRFNFLIMNYCKNAIVNPFLNIDIYLFCCSLLIMYLSPEYCFCD